MTQGSGDSRYKLFLNGHSVEGNRKRGYVEGNVRC